MSSTIRIVPRRSPSLRHALPVSLPSESAWMAEGADIYVGKPLTGRSGSWVGSFSSDTLDAAPLIEWSYSGADQNNATLNVQTNHSRANLSIYNIDLVPSPVDPFSDTHWDRRGNDLVPRSV